MVTIIFTKEAIKSLHTAKARPLILDDAVMNQMMFNFFICASEELNILFEVVSNAKKTGSIDDYEKSALKDETGGE